MGDLALSPAELRRYHTDGFLGPFELCTPAEMGDVRRRLEQVLDGRILGEVHIPPEDRGSVHKYFWKHWHLYSRTVHQLVTRPPIVERMRCLLGNDLLLWKTVFFRKNPRSESSQIGWHQGYPYMATELDPCIVLSCVIAIDAQTEENGRIEVARGCHHAMYPHVVPRSDGVFPAVIDPKARVVNTNDSTRGATRYFPTAEEFEVVPFSLEPGQFIIINQATPHRSQANRSGDRRLGLTARFTTPMCQVMYDPPTRRLGMLPVSGCDGPGMTLNRYAAAPADDCPPTIQELKQLDLEACEGTPARGAQSSARP